MSASDDLIDNFAVHLDIRNWNRKYKIDELKRRPVHIRHHSSRYSFLDGVSINTRLICFFIDCHRILGDLDGVVSIEAHFQKLPSFRLYQTHDSSKIYGDLESRIYFCLQILEGHFSEIFYFCSHINWTVICHNFRVFDL